MFYCVLTQQKEKQLNIIIPGSSYDLYQPGSADSQRLVIAHPLHGEHPQMGVSYGALMTVVLSRTLYLLRETSSVELSHAFTHLSVAYSDTQMWGGSRAYNEVIAGHVYMFPDSLLTPPSRLMFISRPDGEVCPVEWFGVLTQEVLRALIAHLSHYEAYDDLLVSDVVERFSDALYHFERFAWYRCGHQKEPTFVREAIAAQPIKKSGHIF